MEGPSTPRDVVSSLVFPLTGRTATEGPGACVLSPSSASPPGGRRHPPFRRDVAQIEAFCRPASPVRTAAAPERPFYGNRSSGRLAQLFFLHAAPSRLPVVRDQDVHRTNRGSRPQTDCCRSLDLRWLHALGAAAVRTALPTRSRQLSPHCRTGKAGCLHVHAACGASASAAVRSAVLLLVRQRATVSCHRAGRL